MNNSFLKLNVTIPIQLLLDSYLANARSSMLVIVTNYFSVGQLRIVCTVLIILLTIRVNIVCLLNY